MLSRSKFKLGKPEDIEGFLAYTEKRSFGITTGLPSLDRQILGLQGLVAVIGEPKTCKSTLVLQIALHNAVKGVPVLFIDRENGWRHMEQRMVSSVTQIAWNDFCKLPRERKVEALVSLNKLPFELCTEPFTQLDLEQGLVEMAQENPDAPYYLLVIDSLHKMPMGREEMRGSIDDWLLFLDMLKLRFNRKLVILMTCEKRRGTYGAPAKDSAKESGRIEYTVEQALDMYIHPETKQIIVECMYNRHGPSGQRLGLEKVMKGEASGDWGFIFKVRETSEFDL